MTAPDNVSIPASLAPATSSSRMLQRPLYGGVFGDGRYALATMPTITNGLHAVTFMVIEPRDGAVLSVSGDKAQALAGARRLLRMSAQAPTTTIEPLWRQSQLFPGAELPGVRPRKRVSRRRQAIFWRGEGRCHYCRAPLTLDGHWHVEHMMPIALGGGDESRNLVASCPACNRRKRDRTALEFVRSQGVSR